MSGTSVAAGGRFLGPAVMGVLGGLREDRGDMGGDLVLAVTEEPGSDKVSSASDVLVAVLATDGAAELVVFSRRAWEVFSRLRGMPISHHRPDWASFCKNRPGGIC